MHYWAVTDPGCVRSQNQDTYIIQKLAKGAVLCVVALVAMIALPCIFSAVFQGSGYHSK